MALHVRTATVDDARAIAEAHVRGWQVAYQGIVPAAYLEALDVDERTARWRTNIETTTLSNGLPAPTDYVAEVDGQVVGFANVGVFRDGETATTDGELWAMYVHPDAWGGGAAQALMGQTMTHLAEQAYEMAYLWVLEENRRARSFYERQGWAADEVTETEEIGGATITSRRYSIQLTI